MGKISQNASDFISWFELHGTPIALRHKGDDKYSTLLSSCVSCANTTIVLGLTIRIIFSALVNPDYTVSLANQALAANNSLEINADSK